MTRYYYTAFGRVLSSSIPLPELRPTEPDSIHWSFDVVDELPDRELELLGEDPLYGSVSARLFRHDEGVRITIDDTGSYDYLQKSGAIRWKPSANLWWDFGRSHLIGRVLATALQLEGTMSLHGSAVSTAAGVIGFLAPKRFGKSTLAKAMCEAGALFVTDDTLPVSVGRDGVMAWPGIHSLRVDADSAEAEGREPGRDGKLFLPPLAEEMTLMEPAPLSALYLIRPCRGEEADAPVGRARIPAFLAAMRLLGQTKIGSMLGDQFAPAMFDSATSIANAIPVFELSVARDLTRLPEVVEKLHAWHGTDSTIATGGAV